MGLYNSQSSKFLTLSGNCVWKQGILTPATVQPDKDFQAGLGTDREPQSPGLHTKAVSWPLVKSFLSAEPFFPRTVLSLLGLWGEEDFRWARGLSHEGQWRKQLPINQVVTTSKESLLECSECLWSKPRAFTLCSSSPEIPARFPLHSRNVQGCSSNSWMNGFFPPSGPFQPGFLTLHNCHLSPILSLYTFIFYCLSLLWIFLATFMDISVLYP